MKAQEFKNIAQAAKAHAEKAQEEFLQHIYRTIMEEAEKGLLSMTFSGSLEPFLVQKLRAEGFKVEGSTQMNETSYTIDWSCEFDAKAFYSK